MGINYSALRPKEWEARIRELEPKLPAKHVQAISVELTKVDQARANLYTVLIDAGVSVCLEGHAALAESCLGRGYSFALLRSADSVVPALLTRTSGELLQLLRIVV